VENAAATDRAARPAIPERIAGALAVAGGALAIALGGLVTISVLSRWTSGQPVPGDFEFVQMGVALTVFACLPICQTQRGNIVVDTFTSNLPANVRAWIDAGWDVAYASAMGLICWGMTVGALEAWRTKTETMVTQFPLWPALALSALLAAVLSMTTIWTAWRLVAKRR
jgi:TRAP-type C4-dicarboxylate transport system permease small subunit